MPVYLRTAGYKIYFWSNEKQEPIHFHIAKSDPTENDAKVWVLSNGSFLVAQKQNKISEKDLSKIFSIMQSFYLDYISFWQSYFPRQVKFYK